MDDVRAVLCPARSLSVQQQSGHSHTPSTGAQEDSHPGNREALTGIGEFKIVTGWWGCVTVRTKNYPPNTQRTEDEARGSGPLYLGRPGVWCLEYRFPPVEDEKEGQREGCTLKLTLSTGATQLFKLFLLCNHKRQCLPLEESRILELLFASAWFNTSYRFQRWNSGLKSYSLYTRFFWGTKQQSNVLCNVRAQESQGLSTIIFSFF